MNNIYETQHESDALAQYTVVMVDDEQNILQSLKRCFSREKFRVKCAGSGAEGLTLVAATARVAVIVSDQRMPGMNGSEFLTRSREFAPDAIRILLTGYSDMETTVAAMNEGGATHYIGKPWEESTLIQTVRDCVMQYHLTAESRRQQEVISRQNKELQRLLDQLTEQNERLNEAREYAENIVETVREPLVVLSPALKIITANQSFYDTFRVSPDDTIGHFIYELGNRQWDIPALRLLFEEILPHDTVLNGYEVEHDFPGIGRKTMSLNAREIFRENISSHSILLAMEDITERKLAEKMREDIDRITRHDLKTPLNPIIAFPELLLMDTNLTPDQIEWIQLIRSSGYRMLNIIDSSLSLYKMEQGTYKLTPVCFDLFQLIASIERESDQEYARKRLKLLSFIDGVAVADGDVFMLMGEELLCYTMLSNLIKNAIEASPPDEVIKVSCEHDEMWNIIGIHNKGAVPENIRTGFFDKYVTHGKKTGTGLGTYSALLAARTQNGDISMTSSGETGTLITVRLPRFLHADIN